MTNRVNPPKQVILPLEIQQNLPLKKAFDDAYYIMFQMWKRMGGGDDWVDDNRSIGYEFDDLTSLVNSLLPNKPDIKATDIDYTTIGDQTIICNDALTVTLNAEPKDREQVKVIISNGDVTVDGNGKLINKLSDATIIFKNLVTTAALDIVYILELDEWFIV
tara:strand:- start:86 stop:571 length:486 start_codon:yes stop_codon:yes gene_type:complete